MFLMKSGQVDPSKITDTMDTMWALIWEYWQNVSKEG